MSNFSSVNDLNNSFVCGTTIFSFSSTLISNSLILANNLANSDSYHSPVAFGYQPSASRSILSPSLNLVGILNPSALSNLLTTVIFKMFDSVIICLFDSILNKSKIVETLISSKSILPSFTN